MSKVTDVLNKLVIGLGFAMLLGTGVEAAPVVSYSPAGDLCVRWIGCKSRGLSSSRSPYRSSYKS